MKPAEDPRKKQEDSDLNGVHSIKDGDHLTMGRKFTDVLLRMEIIFNAHHDNHHFVKFDRSSFYAATSNYLCR